MEWVAKAFASLGHDVRQAHDLTGLSECDQDCELVLFEQRCAGLNYADVAELARGRQAVWVQWTFDLMATEPGLPLVDQPNMGHRTTSDNLEPTDTLKMMRLMDLTFVKERSMLDDYARLGVEARYLDQGCPSWIGGCQHHERPEFDVCLFGSFRGGAVERRGDVRSLLSEGRSAVWAGHSGGDAPPGVTPLPFTPAEQLPQFTSRAAVTLCVDQRHDLDGYWSDRLWLALGMGACVLRRSSPGLPKAGGRFETYRTPSELNLKLVGLLASTEARVEMGSAARAWVLRYHTYRDRCRRLLREVERWKGQGRKPAESAVAAV